ncbi:MAG: zinc ribbon domain-containing protein [Alteraurantiacibacter sp.]
MELIKGVRAQERAYNIILWLLSLVFAVFIVGLGNLVIGDLPLVDQHIVEEAPTRSAEELANEAEMRSAAQELGTIDDRLAIERLKEEQARRASQTGEETFSAWIAARTATTDPQQDPEVLARTRELEQLKANERGLQATIAELENSRLEIDQRISTLTEQNYSLEVARQPELERQYFAEELRVFGLRLLITLPLLALAAWMVVKQRKSDHWPLMRGFVLAAVFVFFVELVPYLPSYGGYIRYAVGIALTFAAGHYLIKHMRIWLAQRASAEAEVEQERRKRVSHDEAFRKMAAKTCPGCDRPVATTGEAEANFCVHCGMTLYDRCPSCDTRKMAFFRHCMTCGTPSTLNEPASAPT